MENINDTTYDFALVLRQKYTEEILREKLTATGSTYYSAAECLGFTIENDAQGISHGVVATIKDHGSGEVFLIKR